MEGLQGFGWGLIIASLLWSTLLVLMIRKAFIDGHIAGQKACGRVEIGKYDGKD